MVYIIQEVYRDTIKNYFDPYIWGVLRIGGFVFGGSCTPGFGYKDAGQISGTGG